MVYREVHQRRQLAAEHGEYLTLSPGDLVKSIFSSEFLLYSFWLLITKVVVIILLIKISIINLLYQLGLQV